MSETLWVILPYAQGRIDAFKEVDKTLEERAEEFLAAKGHAVIEDRLAEVLRLRVSFQSLAKQPDSEEKGE